MYKSISADELKGLVGRVNIIDIRDSYLFNNGNIPTSKNVPVNFLLFNPNLSDMRSNAFLTVGISQHSHRFCYFI